MNFHRKMHQNKNKKVRAFNLKWLLLIVLSASLFVTISTLSNGLNFGLNFPGNRLFDINSRGGTILRWSGFDLSQPDATFAPWTQSNVEFEQVTPQWGSYRILTQGIDTEIASDSSITVQPNRNYILSALIKSDFDRRDEVQLDVLFSNADGLQHLFQHGGVPNITVGSDGWYRWEQSLTSSSIKDVTSARLSIHAYDKPGDNHKPLSFQIADVALIELPTEPIVPFAPGQGVSFPGGPGNLPMRVEGYQVSAENIAVTTTGAKYTFDLESNTILQEQRLGYSRQLAELKPSFSLSDLSVLRQDNKEVVLTNSNVTIGIQFDTAMIVTPHVEANIVVESKIGGRWNRLRTGHLLALDDFGGFSINPYIPLGTGKIPRSTVLTPLDFEGVKNLNIDSFTVNSFLSKMTPGWKVQWQISPGARLFVSAAPVRPFDWQKSWNYRVAVSTGEDPAQWRHLPISSFTMWEDPTRAFGGSYSTTIMPMNKTKTIADFATIKSNGQKPLPYLSSYFYSSRNPADYVAEVKRWKDEYGAAGVYSDGVPTIDWLTTYEEMRRLREEVFPDGDIQIHVSLGPPIHQSDIFIPFLYAYADGVSMGEGLDGAGSGDVTWPYARYVMAQYNSSGSFGNVIGTNWSLGGKVDPAPQKDVMLVYNGRSNWLWPGERNAPPDMMQKYLSKLKILQKLWSEHRNDPFFFDRYFQPMARRLTGQLLGRAGMPIADLQRDRELTQVTLTSMEVNGVIRYTTDGSEPNANSPLYNTPLLLSSGTTLKTVTFRNGLDSSRVATVRLR